MKVAANQLLEKDALIPSSRLLQEKISDEFHMSVGSKFIRYVMKREMKLRYHRMHKVQPRANSERCLVLRQQYALSLLQLLDQGKRIINVDETWLNETSFQRMAWCRPEGTGSIPLRPITPSLAMISALDTDGRIYFSLGHANTDQDTFMLFMRHLVAKLDSETPGWQENSIILLDNAPYHVGTEARSYLRKMQIPIMYTAPYSYSASPIEMLFSILKLGELNEDREPTGKR